MNGAGAEQMQIEPSYVTWLNQVPSVGDGARGADYYNMALANSAGKGSTGKGNSAKGSSSKGSTGKGSSTGKAGSSNGTGKGSPIKGSNAQGSAGEGQKERNPPKRGSPKVGIPEQAAQGELLPLPLPKAKFEKRKRNKKKKQANTSGGAAAEGLTSSNVVITGSCSGLAIEGGSIFLADPNQQSVVRYSATKLGSPLARQQCAGGNGRGAGAHQLDRPWRIAAQKDTVFICDRNNARIQSWREGASEGFTVAGGRGAGPALDQLNQPVAVALHPVTGDVYISDRANHRVVLWAADATQGVVVAGGNGWGDGLHQLACPAACHVTGDSSVYVCDEANNRVVKWNLGDTEGTVVAGGQGAGVCH